MKSSDVKKLIVTRVTEQIERPLLLEGSPGIGKTTVFKEAAKEIEAMTNEPYGCIVLHSPLMQPEDYGFPVVSPDRSNVEFIVSKSKFPVEGSNHPKRGILVLDELSQVDNAGQKILANLMHAREIHGQRLMTGWTVAATGNRATDRAGATRLLSHVRDRVTPVTLDVSVDDWCQWAIDNGVKPEIISFIRFRPNLLNNFDPQQENNATPRSWVEGVSKVLGVIPQELELETFKGDVGEGAAAEFLGFLRIFRKLPNPDLIIANPKKADLVTDPATSYALCGALAHRATVDNFGAILEYTMRMGPEWIMLTVNDALRREPKLKTCKAYIDAACTVLAKILV